MSVTRRWARWATATTATLTMISTPALLGGSLATAGAAALPGKPLVERYALSAQQLAGQRVIYSYPGLTPPASLLQRIRDGQAAGVIFFGENISGDNQISSVIQQ